MKKSWIQYLFVYGMWSVFIILGILFLVISRNSLTGLLTLYTDSDNFQWSMMLKFIDRSYFLVAGVALFVMVIIIEEYYKRGVKAGVFWQRVFRSFGIEILLLFIVSLISAYLIGISPLIGLVLFSQCLLGIVFTWLGYRKKAAMTNK